ncbi:unnamed protein product [Colias eurytheme]|nr:unnamed protein product [Colias eurytheme]
MDSSILILLTFLVVVCCSGNESAAPDSGNKEYYGPHGALSSLGRMFIDIPLGFVEALKDAAEAIESVAVAVVKGVFS